MYVCIYVCVYILASVCQQLLQLARVKTESSRNNFGELAKMAGVFYFLPLYLFAWWKIMPWIKYLPVEQMLYHDVCPPCMHVNSDVTNEVCVWGYLCVCVLALQHSPSPVRTARWWWLPFQQQWPSSSSQWWSMSWLGGESGAWFVLFLLLPRPRGALVTVSGVVVWLVFNPLSAAQELQALPLSQ